jgi:hypothetical protein
MRHDVATRHQAICFSITEPTSAVENLVATAVGGLGPVHQYVTALAWALAAATIEAPLARAAAQFPALTAEKFCAGVIFNDFPVRDELDLENTYAPKMLVPIAKGTFDAIQDPRFLLQPGEHVRWANAAMYKHLPAVVLTLFGVKRETVAQARDTLELRTAVERTSYHFMRADKNESDSEVQRRAALFAERWFRLALLHRTLFPLGHIAHMVEDSFSPAHTTRDLAPRGDALPYGVVTEVYWFGAQSDSWHSSRESWSAVNTPGSLAEQRVAVCVRVVAALLERYVAALAGTPLLPPGFRGDASTLDAQQSYAEAEAAKFATWLRTSVFALASRGPL